MIDPDLKKLEKSFDEADAADQSGQGGRRSLQEMREATRQANLAHAKAHKPYVVHWAKRLRAGTETFYSTADDDVYVRTLAPNSHTAADQARAIMEDQFGENHGYFLKFTCCNLPLGAGAIDD